MIFNYYRTRDPRLYQIGMLGALLIYGLWVLDLEVEIAFAATIIATALATQYAFTVGVKLPTFDPKSALISALSLCLLLRTDSMLIAALAAVLAIASKFIIRFRGKHIFNPTNFALVSLLLGTDQVWVSPGQWGQTAFLAFLIACLGLLVVNRAKRADVTLAFLGFYLALLFGRAGWLGDPLLIPWHQVQNGAFLLFCFFMIPDPKTLPDARRGRVIFAGLAALGAAFVQFGLYRPNGLLYALAACAPLMPLLDWFFPASRYAWEAPSLGQGPMNANVKA